MEHGKGGSNKTDPKPNVRGIYSCAPCSLRLHCTQLSAAVIQRPGHPHPPEGNLPQKQLIAWCPCIAACCESCSVHLMSWTASACAGLLSFPPCSRGSTKVPSPTLEIGPGLPAATSRIMCDTAGGQLDLSQSVSRTTALHSGT